MNRAEVLARARAEGVRSVRFLYCDNANIIRGKVVHSRALPDFFDAGIGLTVAMQGFCLTEHIAPGSALGPVGEVRLVPDPDTFAVLPYAPGEARLLCDMYTLDRAGAVVGVILDALDRQGLEPRQYYPELGPGQQELSIQHTPLPSAADRQIAVRETVRGVALRHGLVASFAPKPFPDQAGSGCHVHLSLWRNDRNLLYDPQDTLGLSRLGRAFVAGLLDHLPALLAITCPSVNSYRRLAPNMWSSAYTCWGPDNREAAVRLASPFKGRIEATTNVEVKAVDGSANPYLTLGALVAAGLDGIRRDLDPGQPLTVNPHDLSEDERRQRRIRRYPTTLAEALAELERDQTLLDALGGPLAREFLAVRRAEWADLGSVPVDQELATYFRRY